MLHGGDGDVAGRHAPAHREGGEHPCCFADRGDGRMHPGRARCEPRGRDVLLRCEQTLHRGRDEASQRNRERAEREAIRLVLQALAEIGLEVLDVAAAVEIRVVGAGRDGVLVPRGTVAHPPAGDHRPGQGLRPDESPALPDVRDQGEVAFERAVLGGQIRVAPLVGPVGEALIRGDRPVQAQHVLQVVEDAEGPQHRSRLIAEPGLRVGQIPRGDDCVVEVVEARPGDQLPLRTVVRGALGQVRRRAIAGESQRSVLGGRLGVLRPGGREGSEEHRSDLGPSLGRGADQELVRDAVGVVADHRGAGDALDPRHHGAFRAW